MSDLQLSLYKKMYLIREAEIAICTRYASDRMKTPMHMSMGSEAIAAGVCEALGPQAQVLGTYRSHALYIAKTGDTDRFFLEMYGKMGGTANGKGGSLHLTSPEHGMICTSGVVGASIPVALGAAWATQSPVAVFFGDGAMNEGVFWESLNAACAMRLPVLFVCEDNGYAVNSKSSERDGFSEVADVIQGFHCGYLRCSMKELCTDAERVYGMAESALNYIRLESAPAFLHLHYYRYLEHVGVGHDFADGIRDIKHYEKWASVDPLVIMRSKLNDIANRDLMDIEIAIADQVRQSVREAELAPYPPASELYADVYA